MHRSNPLTPIGREVSGVGPKPCVMPPDSPTRITNVLTDTSVLGT